MHDLLDRSHAVPEAGDPLELPALRRLAERRHLHRVESVLIIILVLVVLTGLSLHFVASGHGPLRVITRPEKRPAVRGPDERGLSQWTVPGATAVTLTGHDLWVVGRSPGRGGPWYLAELAGYRISSLAGNAQGVWFVAEGRGTVHRWVPSGLTDA